MNKSWMGPAITALIVAGVAGVLFLNLEPAKPASPAKPKVARPAEGVAIARADPPAMASVEHPIGDEVLKNHMRIAAVWLPAVTMDGMPTPSGPNPVHIEADIKATADNPQGFALDEKVTYLKVSYSILPAAGGPALASGDLTPMMARDGFHYGATIALPAAGDYRLVYEIQPGSVNNLGLHRDPATGVAPWWEPFRASFDWTVDPEPATTALASEPR